MISSTKPKNTHKTVSDTLSVVLHEASSTSLSVIGSTNKPLEVAHKQSELRQDIAVLLRVPTIKTAVNLNQFLEQCDTAPKQKGSLGGEDEDEYMEDEEQED